VPKEISLLLKCRSAKNGRLKTMSISLDGLLDYDEGDKDEATFELSLMAESFNEMLMRDYGSLILKALMDNKRVSMTEEKKRPVAVSNEVPEPSTKKPRQMECQPEKAASEEMDMQLMTESPEDIVHVGDIQEVTMNESTARPSEPTEAASAMDIEMKDTGSNEELLFAFRFFDRAGCGYIKCDDLRRLLHNIGSCLAPRVVRDLVSGVANKEKQDRVYYQSLTDKDSTS